MSKSTVQSVIQRINQKGSPLPDHGTGAANKKLSERDERSLVRIVRKDPFVLYNQILAELRSHEIHISKPTLVRYLHAQGFGSYFAAHKPKLTDKEIKERLRWAKERINWTVEQWRGVVWFDESRFAVEGYDGRARVIREVGERYNTEHIKPASKSGEGNVMLWGCFWVGGVGPLAFVDSSMNQDTNVAENFLPWFSELTEREDREFIFQEDGATCHTGECTTWWKDLHQIKRFDKWPSNSPDLNPLEHVWACLEWLIAKEKAHIENIEELKVVLEGAWREISLDFCERLVASMKDRCQAVIDANGGPTKYWIAFFFIKLYAKQPSILIPASICFFLGHSSSS